MNHLLSTFSWGTACFSSATKDFSASACHQIKTVPNFENSYLRVIISKVKQVINAIWLHIQELGYSILGWLILPYTLTARAISHLRSPNTKLSQDCFLPHPSGTDQEGLLSDKKAIDISLEKLSKHSLDPGHLIKYQFIDDEDGTVYGEEKLERLDSVEFLKDSLKRRCKYLQTLNSGALLIGVDEENLKRHIAFTNKLLINAQKVSCSWISSKFYRQQLSQAPLDSSQFQSYMDQLCLGAPVNIRYHSCQREKTVHKIGFCQTGAIIDPIHSLTNLQELKTLSTSPLQFQQKQREIKLRMKSLVNIGGINERKLMMLKYQQDQLVFEKLPVMIQQRQAILSQQMLYLIQTQIDKNWSLTQGLKTFDMIHVAFLNRTIDEIGKSGFIHNEKNNILDMEEIFKTFAGKKLIFDGQGPFVDLDGHIHLTQYAPHREMTLNTCFFNISVQGHTKNDDIQERINKENLAKLRDQLELRLKSLSNSSPQRGLILAGQEELKSISKRFNRGESNYFIAEDFCDLLLRLKFILSMGCFSDKDRTGIVAGRMCIRFAIKQVEKEHPHNQEKVDRLTERFAKSLLSEEGCAVGNVYDNTQMKILKCSTFLIPGYTYSLVDICKRCWYGFMQIKELQKQN